MCPRVRANVEERFRPRRSRDVNSKLYIRFPFLTAWRKALYKALFASSPTRDARARAHPSENRVRLFIPRTRYGAVSKSVSGASQRQIEIECQTTVSARHTLDTGHTSPVTIFEKRFSLFPSRHRRSILGNDIRRDILERCFQLSLSVPSAYRNL